jgi:hypothetical protein
VTLATNDFLAHYGVKGMKWGVRKNDPYASTESRSLRKESTRKAQAFSDSVMAKRYATLKMSEREYKSLSTGKEFIQKGDYLRRTTKDPRQSLPKETFASRTLNDAKTYNAILAGPSGAKKYKTPVYELDIKAVKKLAGPSEKERVDIFMDVLSKPKVQLPDGTTMTGKDYLTKRYAPELREMSTKQAGLEFYRKFTWLNYETNNPLTRAYNDEVKSRGYDFMTDDNNKDYLTKKPAILLNTKSDTVDVVGIRRLTADEINKAQRELTPP